MNLSKLVFSLVLDIYPGVVLDHMIVLFSVFEAPLFSILAATICTVRNTVQKRPFSSHPHQHFFICRLLMVAILLQQSYNDRTPKMESTQRGKAQLEIRDALSLMIPYPLILGLSTICQTHSGLFNKYRKA